MTLYSGFNMASRITIALFSMYACLVSPTLSTIVLKRVNRPPRPFQRFGVPVKMLTHPAYRPHMPIFHMPLIKQRGPQIFPIKVKHPFPRFWKRPLLTQKHPLFIHKMKKMSHIRKPQPFLVQPQIPNNRRGSIRGGLIMSGRPRPVKTMPRRFQRTQHSHKSQTFGRMGAVSGTKGSGFGNFMSVNRMMHTGPAQLPFRGPAGNTFGQRFAMPNMVHSMGMSPGFGQAFRRDENDGTLDDDFDDWFNRGFESDDFRVNGVHDDKEVDDDRFRDETITDIFSASEHRVGKQFTNTGTVQGSLFQNKKQPNSHRTISNDRHAMPGGSRMHGDNTQKIQGHSMMPNGHSSNSFTGVVNNFQGSFGGNSLGMIHHGDDLRDDKFDNMNNAGHLSIQDDMTLDSNHDDRFDDMNEIRQTAIGHDMNFNGHRGNRFGDMNTLRASMGDDTHLSAHHDGMFNDMNNVRFTANGDDTSRKSTTDDVFDDMNKISIGSATDDMNFNSFAMDPFTNNNGVLGGVASGIQPEQPGVKIETEIVNLSNDNNQENLNFINYEIDGANFRHMDISDGHTGLSRHDDTTSHGISNDKTEGHGMSHGNSAVHGMSHGEVAGNGISHGVAMGHGMSHGEAAGHGMSHHGDFMDQSGSSHIDGLEMLGHSHPNMMVSKRMLEDQREQSMQLFGSPNIQVLPFNPHSGENTEINHSTLESLGNDALTLLGIDPGTIGAGILSERQDIKLDQSTFTSSPSISQSVPFHQQTHLQHDTSVPQISSVSHTGPANPPSTITNDVSLGSNQFMHSTAMQTHSTHALSNIPSANDGSFGSPVFSDIQMNGDIFGNDFNVLGGTMSGASDPSKLGPIGQDGFQNPFSGAAGNNADQSILTQIPSIGDLHLGHDNLGH